MYSSRDGNSVKPQYISAEALPLAATRMQTAKEDVEALDRRVRTLKKKIEETDTIFQVVRQHVPWIVHVSRARGPYDDSDIC